MEEPKPNTAYFKPFSICFSFFKASSMTPLKPMAWWGGSPFPVADVIIKTEQSGPKKWKHFYLFITVVYICCEFFLVWAFFSSQFLAVETLCIKKVVKIKGKRSIIWDLIGTQSFFSNCSILCTNLGNYNNTTCLSNVIQIF